MLVNAPTVLIPPITAMHPGSLRVIAGTLSTRYLGALSFGYPLPSIVRWRVEASVAASNHGLEFSSCSLYPVRPSLFSVHIDIAFTMADQNVSKLGIASATVKAGMYPLKRLLRLLLEC